ncbi:MAG TPA: aldehyde dehydrogenase family protein, partial [Cellvibrionaceae bacterium]|nr:aldehyde dehydrogenase family protein [Cellvibrionaceae bacterium]
MVQLQDPSLLLGHSLIGGVLQAGAREQVITNPATERPITAVTLVDGAMNEQALACAARAQPAWAALSGLERGAILRRWGELMLAHERDLAVILTSEQGKPLAEARAEIAYAASYFYWFAGEAERVYGRVLPVGEGRRHWVEQRPLGIV